MHALDEQSDEDILELALDQPMYFEVLVDRYQAAFLRKSRSILRNEQDAVDAVQDTFVKIYTKGKSFRKQEGAQFSSWGYKILVNTCFTSYSKQKRAQFISALDDDLLAVLPDNFEKDLKRKFDLDEVMSYISKLPDIFKLPAKKFYVEGKSGKQIAADLQVSENVVRTRLHRARNELQKQLTK
jgi:RNA polymerase sigma-70 factor (ECF subfamily)